jgi:dTDP-4-dehydrorhamnose reductase
MNFYKDKIIFTGGTGRFGKIFKSLYSLKNILYPTKKDLDIHNYNSIKKFLKKEKPKIVIHAAGISRPMIIHDNDPKQSIQTNIIGTSNLTIACMQIDVKLIYFSSNYVYPLNNKSNKENDPVLPINNYALSKMGGECAVQMYKNSLILRIAMSESPFVHGGAYGDVKTNFLYQKDVANIIPKIINSKGILNIAGKTMSFYNFAKLSNTKIKKLSAKKILKKKYYEKQIISIKKLKNLLKS